jgi:hypothetical protein
MPQSLAQEIMHFSFGNRSKFISQKYIHVRFKSILQLILSQLDSPVSLVQRTPSRDVSCLRSITIDCGKRPELLTSFQLEMHDMFFSVIL